MLDKIIYQDNFIVDGDEIYDILFHDVPWVREQERRAECFMAHEPTIYRYLEQEDAPVYKSVFYHPIVEQIQTRINTTFNCNMNLCFLNYYENQHQALGWHSDDGEIINQEEPIVVVSIGAVRQLWVRPIGFKGDIPKENKLILGNGSILIMPPGFQTQYQHKIPKGDREMSGRISLTYRSKLMRLEYDFSNAIRDKHVQRLPNPVDLDAFIEIVQENSK